MTRSAPCLDHAVLRPVPPARRRAAAGPWPLAEQAEDEVNPRNLVIPIVLGSNLAFWIVLPFLIF